MAMVVLYCCKVKDMGGLFSRHKQLPDSEPFDMEVSPVIERQAQLILSSPFVAPRCPITIDGFNCTGCAYFMIDAITGALYRIGEEMSDPVDGALEPSEDGMMSIVVLQDARWKQFIVWVVDDELCAQHQQLVSDIVRLELYINLCFSGAYTMPLWSKLQYMRKACMVRHDEWDRTYNIVGLSVGGLRMLEPETRGTDEHDILREPVGRRERQADLDHGFSCGPFSRG